MAYTFESNIFFILENLNKGESELVSSLPSALRGIFLNFSDV